MQPAPQPGHIPPGPDHLRASSGPLCRRTILLPCRSFCCHPFPVLLRLLSRTAGGSVPHHAQRFEKQERAGPAHSESECPAPEQLLTVHESNREPTQFPCSENKHPRLKTYLRNLADGGFRWQTIFFNTSYLRPRQTLDCAHPRLTYAATPLHLEKRPAVHGWSDCGAPGRLFSLRHAL